MIPHDFTNQNFSATRIYITRSGGISNVVGHITYAIVANIVRIEIRVVCRIIFCYYYVFKSCGFKGFVPVFDTGFYCTSPFFRKCRIYIIDDLFFRFYQLSFEIFLQVFFFRLYTPAVNKFFRQDFIRFGCVIIITRTEVSYSIVLITASHRFFGEFYYRTAHCEGISSCCNIEIQNTGNLYVLFETHHLF